MNQLEFRPLQDKDYETICEWWKWWRWPIVEKQNLPNNGTGGFMIEKNGTPIVTGFLYITNSNLTWLEFIVSNPEYKHKDRKQAIELLINKIEDLSRSLGKNTIFSIGKNKHLIETHRKLGWSIEEKPSYEIVKKI
jgi:hypothetical protein